MPGPGGDPGTNSNGFPGHPEPLARPSGRDPLHTALLVGDVEDGFNPARTAMSAA